MFWPLLIKSVLFWENVTIFHPDVYSLLWSNQFEWEMFLHEINRLKRYVVHEMLLLHVNVFKQLITNSGCTVLVRTMAAWHRRFHNLSKTHGRTPLDEWSARCKGLYLHRTTQYRNTKTNIHASSGIRTYDPGKQAAKTNALDRAATGTGPQTVNSWNNTHFLLIGPAYCNWSVQLIYEYSRRCIATRFTMTLCCRSQSDNRTELQLSYH
jgi:hypothetical protein